MAGGRHKGGVKALGKAADEESGGAAGWGAAVARRKKGKGKEILWQDGVLRLPQHGGLCLDSFRGSGDHAVFSSCDAVSSSVTVVPADGATRQLRFASRGRGALCLSAALGAGAGVE